MSTHQAPHVLDSLVSRGFAVPYINEHGNRDGRIYINREGWLAGDILRETNHLTEGTLKYKAMYWVWWAVFWLGLNTSGFFKHSKL